MHNLAATPSAELWSALLSAAVAANSGNSSFILTNFLTDGVARDQLVALEGVMAVSRVVYCKFVDPAGAPLGGELARLAGPEDVSGLVRAMEFVELAFAADKIVSCTAEGKDEDAEGFAKRVADKL